MIDGNVVVTVRQDFNRAIALLRKLGVVERRVGSRRARERWDHA